MIVRKVIILGLERTALLILKKSHITEVQSIFETKPDTLIS